MSLLPHIKKRGTLTQYAASVEEAALLAALEERRVSGAALGVLDCMGLNLEQNPLVGRRDVIVTPHAAFYPDKSLRALQDISCQNTIHCLSNCLPHCDCPKKPDGFFQRKQMGHKWAFGKQLDILNKRW